MYYRKKLFTYETDAVADFQSFVSPEAFTLPSQYADYGLTVDLYTTYHAYSNVNKAYIYEFTSAINTLVLPAAAGLSYRWAETIGGVEYITDFASGTAFTAGSTKRYVIVNNTSTAQLSINLVNSALISLYVSSKIYSIYAFGAIRLKYIFCENLESITSLMTNGFTSCPLTGIINLPRNITQLPIRAFRNTNSIQKINIYENVTTINNEAFILSNIPIYNFYSMIAPTTGTEVFGNYAADLHIKAAATGYDVAPWIDTAIFSQILRDL